jgi:hypothetical protein
MQRDEQRKANAEDDEWNEKVAVGEDALGGFNQRHRNPIGSVRFGANIQSEPWRCQWNSAAVPQRTAE